MRGQTAIDRAITPSDRVVQRLRAAWSALPVVERLRWHRDLEPVRLAPAGDNPDLCACFAATLVERQRQQDPKRSRAIINDVARHAKGDERALAQYLRFLVPGREPDAPDENDRMRLWRHQAVARILAALKPVRTDLMARGRRSGELAACIQLLVARGDPIIQATRLRCAAVDQVLLDIYHACGHTGGSVALVRKIRSALGLGYELHDGAVRVVRRRQLNVGRGRPRRRSSDHA